MSAVYSVFVRINRHKLYLQNAACYKNDADQVTAPHVGLYNCKNPPTTAQFAYGTAHHKRPDVYRQQQLQLPGWPWPILFIDNPTPVT